MSCLLLAVTIINPFATQAQLSDPIPQTIQFGDLDVVLEEWFTVPSTSSDKPYARINMLREVPDYAGKMAINDLNGPFYLVDEAGTATEYIDLSEEFANFIPSPGKGTGFGAFAFHPEFSENGILFTAHAESAGSGTADFVPVQHNGISLQWVVTKWVDNNPSDNVFSGSHSEIMRMDFPHHIHGMQDIAFNPNVDENDDDYGNLYLCVGEGGSGLYKWYDNMQNLESHLGTIFRIDPMGSNSANGKYGIPADNPFVSEESGYGEIWAYGFRNPHRLHFQEVEGDHVLYTGDIGEKTIEELNIVEKGKNYGWNKREGTFLFDIEQTRDQVFSLPEDDASFNFTYPVAQYDHDEGLAINLGHVWNSDKVPAFQGQFFMGDIPSGRLFYVPVASLQQGNQSDLQEARIYNADLEERTLVQMVGSSRVDLKFGYNSQGEVFVLSKANAKVYKMTSLAQKKAEDLVAFPGAEGFGRNATGGRGGRVIAVTNLNDNGAGSLRDAIAQTGARTIVFNVSGVIQLQSPLRIENGDLTIAGQTSPNGITVAGYSTVIGSESSSSDDNIIIRFIRFRMGDQNQHQGDALECRFATNVIIDHCSMSWSIDETMSMYANTNTTFQWNMVTESLDNSFHEKGRHGYGGIWGGSYASFHHNLVAHHTSRNPRLQGARWYGNWNEHMDFRNNLIYNWGGNNVYGGEASDIDGNKANINIVNNYYKPGPASDRTDRIVDVDADPTFGFSNFHVDGNYVDGHDDVTADNWAKGVQGVTEEEKAEIKSDTPFDYHMFTEHSAVEAFEYVVRNAGCVAPYRDEVDERIANEAATGITNFGTRGMIDSQEDVGGYPTFDNVAAPADTDGDGMPDDWEDVHGFNPDDDADGILDADGDGYTNLEEYLNGLVENTLADQIEYIPQPKGLTVETDPEITNRVSIAWADDYPVADVEFILERSFEETSGFEEITRTQDFAYTDVVNVDENKYAYYRIKVEADDVSSLYSSVERDYLRVFVASVGSTDANIVAYPNPSTGVFSIRSSDYEIGNFSIRTLLGRSLPVQAVKESGVWKIDGNTWPKGIYFLTYTKNGQEHTVKLVRN